MGYLSIFSNSGILFLSLSFCCLLIFLIAWIFDPVFHFYNPKNKVDLNAQGIYTIHETESSKNLSKDLTLVLPAYNEELRLVVTLDSYLPFMLIWSAENKLTFEIIIVNDGSKDKTSEISKLYMKQYPSIFRVIDLTKNQGKGAAVKIGIKHAIGKYVLMADADGATDIRDIEKLYLEMKKIEKEPTNQEIGFVLGSRAHMADKSMATRAFYRTILMKGFHLLVILFCTRQIQDTQCGFKLFTNYAGKKLFENLHLYRWAFDIEIIYLAEALGVKMKEVPVRWHEVDGSKLIQTKFDIITTSIIMARDIVVVRLAYFLGFWKLPKQTKFKD